MKEIERKDPEDVSGGQAEPVVNPIRFPGIQPPPDYPQNPLSPVVVEQPLQ